MPLELTNPKLLLLLCVLPVLAWYFYRGLTDFSKWQRVASLVLRGVIVVLLVAALCGLTWLKSSRDLYVIFAIDDSLSVADEAKSEIDSFLNKSAALAQNNRCAYVRFGAEPGPVMGDWAALSR